MERRIKGGNIECVLDIHGVCPSCGMLIGDVYKFKKGKKVLLDEKSKYQRQVVEIDISETQKLPRINCRAAKCSQPAQMKIVA